MRAKIWIKEFVYCYKQLEGKVIPVIVETAQQIKQATQLSTMLTKYIGQYKYKDAKDKPNALLLPKTNIIDADSVYAALENNA